MKSPQQIPNKPLKVVKKNRLPARILEHIFTYLPFHDFKTCRMVSTTWKNTTNDPYLHKSYTISINMRNISEYDENIEKFRGIRVNVSGLPIETTYYIKNIDIFELCHGENITNVYMLRNIYTLDFSNILLSLEWINILKLEGLHKIIECNGTISEGEFKNGKLNGQGKIINHDGTIYKGNFKDGKLNGQGKIIFKCECDGTIFEGEFKNNLLNGQGKAIYRNGDIAEGEFKNNLLNGQGKIIQCDGTIECKCNQIIFKCECDGTIFEGEFKNNLLNGQGKIFYRNGTIIKGEFRVGCLLE